MMVCASINNSDRINTQYNTKLDPGHISCQTGHHWLNHFSLSTNTCWNMVDRKRLVSKYISKLKMLKDSSYYKKYQTKTALVFFECPFQLHRHR